MRQRYLPVPPRPRQTVLEGKEQSHSDCTASPSGQHSTLLRGLPRVSASSHGKKRSHGFQTATPALRGTLWDCMEHHWDLTMIEKWEGTPQNQPTILADGAHYHPKTLIPCRPKLIVHSDQGTHWGAHFPAFDPQISFASLLVWFACNHEKS